MVTTVRYKIMAVSPSLRKVVLDPGFWTKTSLIQLMYGVWVNVVQLEVGLAFGFPAVQVPQLASVDSHVKITRTDASWIASVLTLFSPIGCLISGYIMDRFGRKSMFILCQGPLFIGWLYTGLAKSAKHIIIGRALTGIGCGMAMGPSRIYSTEISLPNMRGVIGAFPSMAMSIGISIQAGLGSFFGWNTLCYICCGFAVTNLMLFFLLPETPYYVLKTESEAKARTNLMKFRGADYNIEEEMKQLIEFKADNDIRKLTFLENMTLLFTRAACKPFTLMNTYILITQASGVTCIVMWAVEILTTAKSSFNANAGNFLLAITRLVVGTITSILLFSVGRRPLALTSAIGVSFVCLSLGCYIHYNDKPSLIPQLSFMAYIAFASLGHYTLPYLMAAELYPLQVRGTLGGITVAITSFLIFGASKLFPLVRDNIGLALTIVIFGVASFLGAIFLYFLLPETKELTLQEIEEYYNDRRPTLVSQRRIASLQMLQQQSQSQLNESIKRTKHKSSMGSKSTLNKLSDSATLAKLDAQRKSLILGRESKLRIAHKDESEGNKKEDDEQTEKEHASDETAKGKDGKEASEGEPSTSKKNKH